MSLALKGGRRKSFPEFDRIFMQLDESFISQNVLSVCVGTRTTVLLTMSFETHKTVVGEGFFVWAKI
jgi:hypothetical protein